MFIRATIYNNVPRNVSGLATTLGVFRAYLSTAESCDGVKHVMRPQGARNPEETPTCLNGFRSIFRHGSTLPHEVDRRHVTLAT